MEKSIKAAHQKSLALTLAFGGLARFFVTVSTTAVLKGA